MLFIESNDEASEYLRNIPKEYQEIDYIESTGTQWINTGYKTNNKISTRMQIQENMSYINSNAIFGDAWSENALFLMAYNGYFRYHYSFSGQNVASITADKTIIETSPTGIKINGTSYSYNVGSTFSSNNIWIFHSGDNANTNMRGRFKLYGFKLYDDGVLVRDFVPCYRMLDGEIGLYDKVEGRFYGNSGSGYFLKGPENNCRLSKFQQVEYIESSGTNCGINTNIQPRNSSYFKVDFKMNPTSLKSSGNYFYGASSAPRCSFEYTSSGAYWNVANTTIQGTHSISVGNDYEYSCVYNNGSFTSSGAYSGSFSYSGTQYGTSDFCFFCSDTGLNAQSAEKLYYLKLYQGENFDLVRDFIPVYKKSDGTIGLYDKVENKFYTNIGSGSFTKGGDIN